MRSRVLRCAAAVMCAVGVAVSAPAGAATGGYPDAMMPCAQAPYATFGTGAWCRNDDWGPVRDTTPNWSVATTHSVRGYGYRNCTDWVAWRLQSFGVPDALTRGLGNGGQWAANAGRNHLSVSSTPKAGDAAVIAGNPGHVAFVEAVHGDGTITVSEYNAVGDGAFDSWTGAPGARGFSAFVDFGLTLHASAAVPPSVIGAVTDAAGALELYWVGADGVLHERVRALRGPWSNEVRLPIAARAVAPATNSRGAVQIFSVGADHAIWSTTHAATGAWSPAARVATGAVDVAATRNADGRLEVFYVGGWAVVEHRWELTAGGAWSGAASLAAGVLHVAATRNADGRLELFTVGGGNVLAHLWQLWAGGPWSGVDSLATDAVAATAATNADGRLEVFFVDDAGGIRHRWQLRSGGPWSGVAQLGGRARSVAVARNADGRLELFSVGLDGAVWHQWQSRPGGPWVGPVTLGGYVST